MLSLEKDLSVSVADELESDANATVFVRAKTIYIKIKVEIVIQSTWLQDGTEC